MAEIYIEFIKLILEGYINAINGKIIMYASANAINIWTPPENSIPAKTIPNDTPFNHTVFLENIK